MLGLKLVGFGIGMLLVVWALWWMEHGVEVDWWDVVSKDRTGFGLSQGDIQVENKWTWKIRRQLANPDLCKMAVNMVCVLSLIHI